MVSKETDPSIDLRRLEASGIKRPVLICLGGGGTAGAPMAAALIEVGRGIELGRGAAPPGAQRFQTNDPMMSRRHAELSVKLDGTVLLRDLDSSNGTWIDGVRMYGQDVLRDGAVIFAGAHVFVHRQLTMADRIAIEEEMNQPFAPYPTVSPATARLIQQMRQLAQSDLDLLLGGETGVGKEVYAQAIHRASGRKGSFVAINCAALPEALIESELFGYAKGAHSMADQSKPGLLEQADGGTLFLDEIGDMPGVAQSKLLRFLQDGSFVPLGAVRPRRVEVRVIAATRRAITDVGHGLRVDLAARLGPQALVIPPLRDRLEDVAPLACGFLRARNAVLEPQAWRALFLHRWPGNVRELQKTLRFAIVVAGASPSIGFEHLPPGMSPVAAAPNAAAVGALSASSGPTGSSATITLGAVSRTLRPERPTRQALVELLKRHDGDVASMARTMGRQRTLVWRWLRQDGVDPQVYRPGDPVEDTEVQSEDAEPRPRPPEETLPFQSVKGRYTGEA